MQFNEVVAALEARVIMPAQPPDLSRTEVGLTRIGFFDFPFWKKYNQDLDRIICVAGTNGKGSTCATLEALLLAAGERVGFYSSPHLEKVTERIRIAGEDVDEESFCRAYEFVESRTRDLSLSHFEMLTLMAAWLFCAGPEGGSEFGGGAGPIVDRIILEVGMGGRWDATNAIPHGFCIITPLGLDHQNLLGDTLTEIAANKFDIVQSGNVVVHAPFTEDIALLAWQKQEQTQSRWIESEPGRLDVKRGGPAVKRLAAALSGSSRPPEFFVETRWGRAQILLPGLRGAQNTALALTAFNELGFDSGRYLDALMKVRWPGRMEMVKFNDASVFLSGDHNPQGIQSLIELLPYYEREHLYVLVGVGKDKDCDGCLAPLFQLPNTSVYLTETSFKPLPLKEYGQWLKRARSSSADPFQALQEIIKKAGPRDMILVTGSLYLVGLIRSRSR
jgi:dihydrofolate synthase/folylpolyglutamate synthase